tara:strand:+ start:1071 stop:2420 length:1350 start_codon:yes stop_codon:yes gene_type:complete
MLSFVKKLQLLEQTSSAPLATFRIFFGLMMLFSLIRFWSNGWIKTLYIDPHFHFKYFGFNWVSDWGQYTYLLFVICGLSTILITLGLFYRFGMAIFFLSFTYIELIDKTTYLNHYYFISVLALLLFLIPANANFSIDNIINKKIKAKVYNYHILSIKGLIFIIYFCAGLAKINSDWLLNAQPLSIWLPTKYDLPILGGFFFEQSWVHYLMSWGGMLYDISIPFLLIQKKTRWPAFVLVIIFHFLTAVLFPIGMFPYIMIVSCLIFFSTKFHERILTFFNPDLDFKQNETSNFDLISKFELVAISLLILFQMIFPFRHYLYPGELFWHEQGYRFSWRVMLMEKKGYTQFKIVDSISKTSFYAKNEDFLTNYQEKQMSFQPDFILEFAHYLGKYYSQKGIENIQVFADSYVALNGRRNQRFIDPKINLLEYDRGFKNKSWILPFKDEIKGF